MALLDIVACAGAEIILEESRGNIGVLVDITPQFDVEMELPSLGGSCTYPAQTDVRSGITYGDIYTGNLELPIESNVLIGVQYGANGTEYTGTASVGGAGGIFILNE